MEWLISIGIVLGVVSTLVFVLLAYVWLINKLFDTFKNEWVAIILGASPVLIWALIFLVYTLHNEIYP